MTSSEPIVTFYPGGDGEAEETFCVDGCGRTTRTSRLAGWHRTHPAEEALPVMELICGRPRSCRLFAWWRTLRRWSV